MSDCYAASLSVRCQSLKTDRRAVKETFTRTERLVWMTPPSSLSLADAIGKMRQVINQIVSMFDGEERKEYVC